MNSKKFNKEELKKTLTAKQFDVICNEGTEPPFQNEYWNHKEAGLYVDRVSGEPLFASIDKFDSGTGWPSFTKPVNDKAVETKIDFKLVYPRKEVRSASSDAHLGHVFDDGPEEAGGLRFCINSASLKFIPLDELDKSGYGEFLSLFKSKSLK
jgi:methionine-R-sulfoxide reductase